MRDFSKGPAARQRRLIGAAFVAALHVVLIAGLMSGLARKDIEIAHAPIETKVIEDIAKPPPPPELPPPPPPKLEAPPPPFIPPPEVQVALPPPPTAITPTPTPAPATPAPVAPTPPAPPVAAPAPAAPVAPSVGVNCPGYQQVLIDGGYPREARRDGIDKGEVTVTFTIAANGEIKNPVIQKSSNRAFNRHSLQMVRQFKCVGQGQEVVDVPVTMGYTME